MHFKRCHCSSEIHLLHLRLQLEVNFSFGGLLEQLSARLEDTPTGTVLPLPCELVRRSHLSFIRQDLLRKYEVGFDYACLSPMARLFFMYICPTI